MSKIVSRKIWVQLNQDELAKLIGAAMDDPPAAFEVIEIQPPKVDGHRIESVTFGLRIKEALDG